MRYLPLLVLLPMVAFGAPSNLTSDLPMEFDGNANSLVARQNATFTHNGLALSADEIRYQKDDNTATAIGNARANFQMMRMVAQKIVYNSQTEHFAAENFRLGLYPFLIEGESADGTRDAIVVHHAKLTMSQTGHTAPAIDIGEMTVRPGDKSTFIKLERALARFDRMPLLPVPFLAASVPNANFPQMEAEAGRSGNFGEYLRTSSLMGPDDGLSAGANLDYYSRRGFLAGPNLRWKTGSFLTDLSSGYISDRGHTGEDINNKPIDNNRGFIQARSKGTLGKAQVTARIDYWSDSEVLRDFRPQSYRDNPSPDNFVEAVIPMKNAYLSAFTRLSPNNFEDVTQRLPEVRFDKLSSQIGETGITYSLFNSAAVLENDAGTRLNRLDSTLSLRKVLHPKSWWEFTPLASARVTNYSKASDSSGSFTRAIGEVGFDSTWTFSRIWEHKSDTWNINGLRHLVQPTVQYRYLPNGDKDSARIIGMDTDAFGTSVLRPLDLWQMNDTDAIDELNVLRFGLKQSLQTRQDPKQGFPSRDLVTFDIYQDINLATNDTYHTVGDFYTRTAINPASWLTLGGSVRLNWEDMTWRESSLWTTVRDGDVWTVTLGNRFRQNDTNQYGLSATYRLTRELSLLSDITFDAYEHRLSNMEAGLHQQLRSGWGFFYGITRREGDERNSSNTFTFRVTSLEF